MLSRIFWIGIAGIALIAGMAWQDGGILTWDDRAYDSWYQEREIEKRVQRDIDRGFAKMQVVDADGREIEVPAETKRAMANAVGELVKAEADLAITRIGDENPEEMQAAQARRNRARAEVERLKAEIKNFERAAQLEQAAVQQQIGKEVRDNVRATVRESVQQTVRN